MGKEEDISEQVNPLFLAEYFEGVEDGEEEYGWEDSCYLEDYANVEYGDYR